MVHGAAPQQIGRYEILGRLATGGMAEVLLGRLRGPHGFERAVVVKRILPHLALDKTVVDMFLDEARIIANLRHPNLIHVHELGHDGGQFFMVMEFLEGEAASGLCRRMAGRGEQLDFNLAAHIVAEACAGLNAAHEATTPEGRHLEIVHRDVSPQNIFVTYAGGVHVIDFGIATAADRVSRTEAGTVRGKFQYVAPEQLQSLPIDRRADVFSLGVVLLELASGRRVYKRDSQAATLMAILSEAAPKLTALRPGAPAELEAICARALAKGRRDRYQTAAEMRRALLAFLRKRSDEDLSESLAKLMREAFPDRIAQKADLLRRVREGSQVDAMPAAEVDIQVEIPAVEQPTLATGLSQSVATAGHVRSRRDRRRVFTIGGLVAATAMVTAAIATSGWWRPATSAPAAGASSVVRADEPPPIADTAGPSPSETPSPPPTPGLPAATESVQAAVGTGAATAPSSGSARPSRRSKPGSSKPPSSPTPKPSPTLW